MAELWTAVAGLAVVSFGLALCLTTTMLRLGALERALRQEPPAAVQDPEDDWHNKVI